MDAESQLAAALVELESDAGWSDTSTKDGCVYRTRDGKVSVAVPRKARRGFRHRATLVWAFCLSMRTADPRRAACC